jgi:hypothetical protein
MRLGATVVQRLFKKSALWSVCFVSVTSALAQQPSSKPPSYDESTLYQAQTNRKHKMPPDIPALPRRWLSAVRVKQEIQKRIKANPAMATANVTARVNDNSVVLTGTVDSSRQHDLALLIAHSWAGQQKIVDQIKRRM